MPTSRLALPLAARLAAGFGVLLVIIAVTGVTAVSRLHALRSVHAAAAADADLVEHLLGAQLAARAAANDERGYLLSRDPKFRKEQQGRAATVAGELDKARELASPETAAALDAIADAYLTWQRAVDAEFDLLAEDPDGAVAAAFGPNRDLRKAFETKVGDVQEVVDRARVAAEEDSVRQTREVTTLLVALVGVAMLVGPGVCVVVVRSVRRPLAAAAGVLVAAADGDLTGRLTVSGRDEVAQLSGAVNTTLESFAATVGAMQEGAGSLRGVSGRLTQASEAIADTAHRTSSRATSVAAAADEVSQSVQTVAAGSEEVGASMGEIARNVQDAVQVAAEGAQVAAATSRIVDKLGDSSTEIGNVVKVITSIAEQTNLLALNATIEAARAGDAGRGFAVVAGEVKELAQETARATEIISGRVEAIQSDTRGAVEAMTHIGAIIERINTFQAEIASAVEQQAAVTVDMNRSVSGAAVGSGRIAETIGEVAGAAQSTSEHVDAASAAAEELLRMSTDLQAATARFRR